MNQIDHNALLAELREHVAADKLVKGSYWEDGKGCAVGCTLHSYAKVIGNLKIEYGDHSIYDSFLGAGGHMLGRLEDCIFEGMINKNARDWPERFLVSALKAIERGSTLKFVGWKFLHWLLTDEAVNAGINYPLVRDAVRQCAGVILPLTKGEKVDAASAAIAARSAASAARSAEGAAWSTASAAWSAESAARSAESAARSAESAAENAEWSAASAASAARSARSAASAWSAASAAESAARSAAESAEWSARSAARSAESAESAESAWSAAYKLMSDKLVELMDVA